MQYCISGCKKVLVLDGNMKNARQVCMLKEVGELHFCAVPGSLVVGEPILVFVHLISKSKTNNRTFLTMPPSLIIQNNVFHILMKKSKDYYTKLISKKSRIF